MDEQEAAPPLELVGDGGEAIEIEQRLRSYAGADEPVQDGVGGEGEQTSVRGGGEIEDAPVVGVEQVGRKPQRGRAGDEGDVDSLLVEPAQTDVQGVSLEIELGGRLALELELPAAQPRRQVAGGESGEKPLGEKVLVDVVGWQGRAS